MPDRPEAGAAANAYDRLDAEYYDATLHPTCRNFREASAIALSEWLGRYWTDVKPCVEVGAGASLVAELLATSGQDCRGLTITDDSERMLSHSLRWRDCGAIIGRGNALALPFADGAFGSVVSVLGDPYNQPQFWQEVRRVLRLGGRCFFSTPSHEWATRFRAPSGAEVFDKAEFVTRGGDRILVPSYIRDEPAQRTMIEAAGLRVHSVRAVTLDEIGSKAVSAKLRTELGGLLPVVLAYDCEG